MRLFLQEHFAPLLLICAAALPGYGRHVSVFRSLHFLAVKRVRNFASRRDIAHRMQRVRPYGHCASLCPKCAFQGCMVMVQRHDHWNDLTNQADAHLFLAGVHGGCFVPSEAPT